MITQINEWKKEKQKMRLYSILRSMEEKTFLWVGAVYTRYIWKPIRQWYSFPPRQLQFLHLKKRRENALNLHPIIRKISLKHTKHTKTPFLQVKAITAGVLFPKAYLEVNVFAPKKLAKNSFVSLDLINFAFVASV